VSTLNSIKIYSAFVDSSTANDTDPINGFMYVDSDGDGVTDANENRCNRSQ
jgi:hypothetical protein